MNRTGPNYYINISDGDAYGNESWKVDPGEIGGFTIDPSTGTVEAGVAFYVNVTAYDEWGNVKLSCTCI